MRRHGLHHGATNRNLLVVANGVGYIVEVLTNVLTGEVGRDVAVVVCDSTAPLLLIDRGGTSLEAFGADGRTWETGAIACGGFRDFAFVDEVPSFEARQEDGEWAVVEVSM